jgi:hypothetical protein
MYLEYDLIWNSDNEFINEFINKVCEFAVLRNGLSLRHIKEEYRTEEISNNAKFISIQIC